MFRQKAAPTPRKTKPWRSRFRISIRGLCLLVLVSGTWWGWMVREARVQQAAVSAIRGSGGVVQYDWEAQGRNPVSRPKPWWIPQILVDWLGTDFFAHVEGVFLFERVEPMIGHVGHFRRLERLTVRDSAFDAAGMVYVRGLSNLAELDLMGTKITDAGLPNLSGLTALRELRLQATKITDAGLEHLGELKKLELLYLDATVVGDAGLVHLKHLANLKELHVQGTLVTESGAKELKRALPNLKVFH